MVRRSERLTVTFQCGRWNLVWKLLSEHGYDTTSGGLVCIDYGNQEYAAVLGFFATVDADVADSLERLARFWPTLSMRSPYTDAAEELGDVLEGPLPELFNKLFSLMRLVQKIDSWTTGYVKWKQTRVQRMRTILPTTAEFLDQWDEGSHRWPCLLVALYRLIRHIEDMSERVRITME